MGGVEHSKHYGPNDPAFGRWLVRMTMSSGPTRLESLPHCPARWIIRRSCAKVTMTMT
jgi:hypothetical protein